MLRQRAHNALLAAALSALVLLPALSAAGAASASPAASHQRSPRGGGSSTGAPLLYGGGKLLASSTTYAIWWGQASSFPSDAEADLPLLLQGFGGSRYLAIASQYLFPAGTVATSSFGGSLADPSAPPAHSPATSTVVSEVASVLANNGLSPDPNAVYLVYTSNFPHVNFCAWHAAGTIRGVTVQVAYLPNTAGVTGCDPGNLYGANSYTEGTRSLADSTAHEFMEATTDPVPASGWADKSGQEIGDKCNFQYSAPVLLSNGSEWQLQMEWSNAAGGCAQGS